MTACSSSAVKTPLCTRGSVYYRRLSTMACTLSCEAVIVDNYNTRVRYISAKHWTP